MGNLKAERFLETIPAIKNLKENVKIASSAMNFGVNTLLIKYVKLKTILQDHTFTDKRQKKYHKSLLTALDAFIYELAK